MILSRSGLLSIFLAFVLSACGGTQRQAVGVEEETFLIIYAESLIDAKFELDENPRVVLQKSDLQAYELGVLGAKDGRRERMDAYRVRLDSGSHTLSISLATGKRHEREMYFSRGQQREWFIE